jgi:hypothetical protein
MRWNLLPLLGILSLFVACGKPSTAPREAQQAGAAQPTARAQQPPTAPAQQTPAAEKARTAPKPGSVMYLHRYTEPKEQAFTILVPEGWIAEGGILRVNPFATNGVMNTVGAKVDFAVKKDAAGTVMLHWLPHYFYKDPRTIPFFHGTQYQGMPLIPLQNSQTFLMQHVFRGQRPRAQNVQVVERKPLPELAQLHQKMAHPLPGYPPPRFDGGLLAVTYDENGVRYKEKMIVVIEDGSGTPLGAWQDHETLAIRAPVAEFDQDEKLLGLIQGSLKSNPVWVIGERQGADQRAHNARVSQQYIQKVAHEIAESRRQTNAEIRHSTDLFLRGKEDYVNPHTGEVEEGSNEWKHRWVDHSGNEIYTNDPDYDPNYDRNIRAIDYKRSEVAPGRQ